MIDTKELRRLAQAATPGPWYVTGKLTRYVEARIDGGLIQEVAACGPTKADGGYGPQQEANARLIAAANPATISEILDRLEAAEKNAAHQKALAESALRVAEGWERKCAALRAKIARMERQEPVGEIQRANSTGNYINSVVWVPMAVGAKLYALPGAKG